ncbi:MAG TPA: hypothetical protein VF498_05125, partial [Anaerolineales bacterium]
MKRHTVRLASLAAIAILLIAASAPIAAAASATGLADAPEAQSLRVVSGLQRIRFASDATSAVVSGDLAANSTARYILRAGAGQLMDVGLSAPDGVSLYVTTADGRALARLTGSSTAFRGILPRTGDYILRVTSGAAPASYSLNVMIPQGCQQARQHVRAEQDGPQRKQQGGRDQENVLGRLDPVIAGQG